MTDVVQDIELSNAEQAFLRELLRCETLGKSPTQASLLKATGCASDDELSEVAKSLAAKGLIAVPKPALRCDYCRVAVDSKTCLLSATVDQKIIKTCLADACRKNAENDRRNPTEPS